MQPTPQADGFREDEERDVGGHGHILLRLLRAAGVLAVLVAVFAGSLTLVYSIPRQRIVANARASLPLLEAEGVYPSPFGTASLQLDGFTDGLMIDTAISNPGDGAVAAAMKGERQAESPPQFTITALARSVEGARTRPVEYSRYWHGYQLFLRPALVALPYAGIRYLNLIALSLLAVLCFASVRRAAGTASCVALAGALLLTGFYVVPVSLQFSSVTYLMFASMVAALELERGGLLEPVEWEFWLVVGSLTAFFDLLTAPLLTLGMPLVALLLSRAAHGLGVRRAGGVVSAAGLAWGAGYLVSWSAKWAIGSLVLGHSVFGPALGAAALNTGATPGGRPILGALARNVRAVLPPVPMWAWALLVAAASLACVAAYARDPAARRRARLLAPALAPGALPFVWIAAASTHSFVHYWFTYRSLAIPLFAGFAVVAASLTGRTPSADRATERTTNRT